MPEISGEASSDGELGEIVGDVLGDAPLVSPNFVAEFQKNDAAGDGAAPLGPIDAAGETFDPSRHCFMPDGVTPRKNIDGKFRRRAGAGQLPPASPPEAAAGQPSPQAQLATEAEAMAKLASTLLFSYSQGLIGPEWEPTGQESELIESAFKDYFVATGTIDLPPWAKLAIVLSSYAGLRFKHENTRKKIGSLIAKIPGVGRRGPVEAPPPLRISAEQHQA